MTANTGVSPPRPVSLMVQFIVPCMSLSGQDIGRGAIHQFAGAVIPVTLGAVVIKQFLARRRFDVIMIVTILRSPATRLRSSHTPLSEEYTNHQTVAAEPTEY